MEKNSMNRAQFRTFILLYVANSDMKIKESEIQYIRDVAQCENFEEIKALFEGSSDYECIQLIMSYRDRFFSTAEAQNALLKEVTELFGKDGNYSLLEENTMKIFKKLIH